MSFRKMLGTNAQVSRILTEMKEVAQLKTLLMDDLGWTKVVYRKVF